ncbi:DUF2330 domain-containing protein [Candidatus Falkowbacteria bacterium]|nr:DUF2330 domain-containing protein [Candidatus Falkowbacteria bacterium]
MKKFKKLFVVISLMALIFPAVASADGAIFPPPDYWMQETDQKAVIFHEKNVETMVLSVTFRGDAKDFSWIVPTPSRPDVSKSTDELFTALAKLTESEYDYGVMPMYGGAVFEGAPARSGVTVLETKKVEYYDISVLEADDPEALTKWLKDNNYQFPENGKYLFDDYINNKWYFTAIKIDAESLSTGVESELREGHAVPLKFTFTSSKIVYPLKISGIAEYFKSPTPTPIPLMMESGAVSGSGTVGVAARTSCFAASDCNEIFCPQVVGQDTPCCVNGQCVCGPSDCAETVPSEIYPVPVPYWQPNVTILLYVFADHKKDLPGFTTDYANWVKSKDIEKLAIESNGESWINATAKKYYLTKLSNYMQPSEMTYDLYLRDANDNDTVGVPQGDWQNTLTSILVFFIALSIFLVIGVISPLGLIFVVCILLQLFIKSKVVRILAWIFQGLVLLATAALGVLMLFGWFGYGMWYGSMGYGAEVTYAKSFMLAALVAWIIFVAAMVAIVVWQILHFRKKK